MKRLLLTLGLIAGVLMIAPLPVKADDLLAGLPAIPDSTAMGTGERLVGRTNG